MLRRSSIENKERYKKIHGVGEGSYGVVYKAKDQHKEELCALKSIKLERSEGIPTTALREIALLKEINHPNIVK